MVAAGVQADGLSQLQAIMRVGDPWSRPLTTALQEVDEPTFQVHSEDGFLVVDVTILVHCQEAKLADSGATDLADVQF